MKYYIDLEWLIEMILRLNECTLSLQWSFASYAQKLCLQCKIRIRSTCFEISYWPERTLWNDFNFKRMHTFLAMIICKLCTKLVFVGKNRIRSNCFEISYWLEMTHWNDFKVKRMHTFLAMIICKLCTKVVFVVEN